MLDCSGWRGVDCDPLWPEVGLQHPPAEGARGCLCWHVPLVAGTPPPPGHRRTRQAGGCHDENQTLTQTTCMSIGSFVPHCRMSYWGLILPDCICWISAGTYYIHISMLCRMPGEHTEKEWDKHWLALFLLFVISYHTIAQQSVFFSLNFSLQHVINTILFQSVAFPQILFWDVRYAKSQLASLVRSRSRPDGAHRAPVAGIRFLGDGRHLVSVGRDGAAAVWDLLTGRHRPLTVPPLRLSSSNSAGLSCQLAVTAQGRRQLAFLPCGDQVVTCDLGRGEAVQRLDGHLRPVTACQYDSREGRLLTSAADGQVLVWTGRRAPLVEEGRKEGEEKKANGGAADHLMRDQWSDDE